MGKSSNQKKPNRGQYSAIGQAKSKRRQNATNGQKTPRKLTPYIRKEQEGTAVETFLNNNFAELQRQGNLVGANGPFSMSPGAAIAGSRLRSDWDAIKKRMTGAKAIKNYIHQHGGTAAQARKALNGGPWISFGADPKSK